MAIISQEQHKLERQAAQRLQEHFTRPVEKASGHIATIWASAGRLGVIADGFFYPLRSWPDFGELRREDIGKQIHRIGRGAAAFYQVENESNLRERLAKVNRTPACFDTIKRDLDAAAMGNLALAAIRNAPFEDSSL